MLSKMVFIQEKFFSVHTSGDDAQIVVSACNEGGVSPIGTLLVSC